jgi:uncharacterized cupin superfamily protein
MSTNRRHPNVVNVEEVEPLEQGKGKLGSSRRRLGAAAGGAALGCTYLEVAPGKTAFPFHFHSAFEEALFILEGEGTARIGKETVAVRTGDYLVFPAGPAAPHALANTGTAPLRYLALSSPATRATMDIVVYPDSKKVAFASGVDPIKGFRGGAWVMNLIKEDQPKLDYYDGEPLAEG